MKALASFATLWAIGVLTAPVAHAQWSGKGEAGALVSRGNAEATSANVKFDVAREAGAWKNSAFLGVLYGRNASFTTVQRVEARWQTDRKIGERLFWFGALRGEQDRFSGFQYQATLSAGLGCKFIDNESTQFSGSLGGGYRRLRAEELMKSPDGEVLDRISGPVSADAVANAALNFSHQLTATTKLLNRFLAESGESNTTAQNDFAVQVNVTEKVALSVGYGVHYNTKPPEGAKSTDQLTTVNLVYEIK